MPAARYVASSEQKGILTMAFPPKPGGGGLAAWAKGGAKPAAPPAPHGGGLPPPKAPAPPGAPPPPPGGAQGAPGAAVTLSFPPGHQAGQVVPKGGASCDNCKYGMKVGDKGYCNEPNFVRWSGNAELPAPLDEYSSDWWTPKAGEKPAEGAPATPPAAPEMPPAPSPPG